MPVASPARSYLRLVDQSGAVPRDDAAAARLRDLDDGELVLLAREDVPRAFEWLYRRHAAFALNLAARVQGDGTDIEDIVHDAFVRAHEELGALRDPTQFRSWLGAIVIHLVRSRLRKQRFLSAVGVRSAEPLDINAIAAAEAGPEARALLAQLYALLNTLSVDDRIAWTLRYVEQHRLEAVAELTRCSLATAKRRILRAERYLDQYFVRAFPEAPQHV